MGASFPTIFFFFCTVDFVTRSRLGPCASRGSRSWTGLTEANVALGRGWTRRNYTSEYCYRSWTRYICWREGQGTGGLRESFVDEPCATCRSGGKKSASSKKTVPAHLLWRKKDTRILLLLCLFLLLLCLVRERWLLAKNFAARDERVKAWSAIGRFNALRLDNVVPY